MYPTMTSNHERSCYLYIMPRCDRWSIAYRHPGGHRTSNMLDRLMRGMNRYFDHGQHLHGSLEACRLHCRAWALLWNFAPWHPATARENQGWRCPAERLNHIVIHTIIAIVWLQHLLISASLGGYRCPLPQKSVTVSEFLGLGQVPTPARTPCRWVAGITRRRVGAYPTIRGLQAKFTALVDSN